MAKFKCVFFRLSRYFIPTCFLLAAAPCWASADPSRFQAGFQALMTLRQMQSFEDVVTTTPYWRRQADLNQFAIQGEYLLKKSSKLEFEIEIEHGGTGSSLEYEPMEEFGEFEIEQEKGGEVLISELYYELDLQNASLQIGKVPVAISLQNIQDNPLLFAPISSVSAESTMLPNEWRELGVSWRHPVGPLQVNMQILTGLNSEFFRKYNWIGGGYQKRFENINTNSLAGVLGLEYGQVAKGNGLGLAYYWGEVAGNRYKKNKLAQSADLSIVSLFGTWSWRDIEVRSELIHGRLSHSSEISAANATLSSSVNPGAFSSLGHTAQLEMIELAYSINRESEDQEAAVHLNKIRPFFSYEHVDTMKSVEGSILKDDRYNQMIVTVGTQLVFDQYLFAKIQCAQRSNALVGMPATQEIALGLGFHLEDIEF